jgi:MFS family permease
MRNFAAAAIVFVGGFIIMVLEIVGTRFLAKDFGTSYYVWVNQIGLVMVALALGYYLGGMLADRWRRLGFLAWLLVPAGIFTFYIPDFADKLMDFVRTPDSEPMTPFRYAMDPVMGSAVVFLLPCVMLAMLSPYLTQLSTRNLSRVGRASGLIFAASTVGSIAGVFVSGYYLLQNLTVPVIFHATGAAIMLLAAACVLLNSWLLPPEPKSPPASPTP